MPSAAPCPVALSGPLTIYTAAESKPLLLAALETGADVELDLSAVDEFDSAGLQLLILARREAASAGCSWRLGARSAAVQELLELSGLADVFDDLLPLPPLPA